jgi:uncharacterized caspase-like protein
MKISARFRKGLMGLSLLLLTAFTPAWANTPWEAGKKYALVVGIDDYQNESVTDLKCATSDAKLFKETLVKQARFPEDNIFLFTTGSVGENSQPSLTNIVFRLEWLREIVGPGDTLVFYFAGHGVSMDSETFLLTQEADQRSKNTLMVSSLPGKALNMLLKDAGAQNTLVLLDACRNDPTAGRGDVNNTLSETMARGLVFKPLPAANPGLERNTATVFSCSEGERSWEWGDKNQGFFTYYLSEALSSGAYDPEGKATLKSLVSYLREKVNTAATREANQAQTPMLKYEGPGADKWVLARTSAEGPKETFGRAQAVAEAEELRRLKAENEELQAKLAQSQAEDALAKAKQASEEQAAKAQYELELAMARADAATREQELAKATSEQAQATAAALEQMAFGNPGPDLDAKVADLQRTVENLQGQREKLAAEVVKAKRKLMELKRNPYLGANKGLGTVNRNVHRSGRPSDLWWFEETDVEEAEDL